MCGIVGYWHKSENTSQNLPKLKKATARLSKRGPDYIGFFNHRHVALGHARLSVIDTSPKANQPFSDESENYTIVFNGEIYNYEQHRRTLEKKGITFRTQSDTEVLLELYKQHREKTPELLNGFFAFAIYDKSANNIFIARDRFGIKPLFIYENQNQICFASEIKALLEFDINKTLDYTSLHRYFQLNYIPGPKTIFEHIKHVEPATAVTISNQGISTHTYYTPPKNPTFTGGYKEAQQKLKSLILTSIEQRLIADVPVGSFLSGGIDSSIIAILAAKLNPNIKSYSIGFPDEPYYDETEYAKAVAQKAGLKHHIIEVHSKDMLNALPNIVDYIDQPFADSSALAVYILSQKVKQHVTVALSGDGADELFGGYRKHMAHKKAINKSLINTLVKTAEPILHLTPQSRQNKITDKARQALRFSQGIKKKGASQYWFWASISSQEYTNKLLIKKWPNNQQKPWEDLGLDIPQKYKFHHILNADIKMLLSGDMLTKVDLMSMANSLEIRVPFLDHELVDFAMQLPTSFKINENKQKRILHDSFKDELPDILQKRPKKGFEVPLINWFRKELNPLIFNELLDRKTIEQQNIFAYHTIHKLKKQLISPSPGDSPAKIWALIVFQEWWKRYMN